MEESDKEADPQESKPTVLESDLSFDASETGQLLRSATPAATPTESNSVTVQSKVPDSYSCADRLRGLPMTIFGKMKMVTTFNTKYIHTQE